MYLVFILLLLLTNCNAHRCKNNKEPSNNRIICRNFLLNTQSSNFTFSRNPEIYRTKKTIIRGKLGETIKLNCEVRACNDIYFVSWSHRPLFSYKRKRIEFT